MQILDDEYQLVLFDLDGTLIDTAPDMVAVLQSMQSDHGRSPASYETARKYVSHGAIGLLSVGFPELHVEFGGELHQEYLERYSENICEHSQVFPGVDRLLDELDEIGCPWGVVTNKPKVLTNPLMAAIGLAERSAATVSGDTLAVRKPDPGPVLLGCDIAGVEPHLTLYVGDADRDIEAGRRAGTATIAVGYGYITDDDDPREWDADIIAESGDELAQIVLNAVTVDG